MGFTKTIAGTYLQYFQSFEHSASGVPPLNPCTPSGTDDNDLECEDIMVPLPCLANDRNSSGNERERGGLDENSELNPSRQQPADDDEHDDDEHDDGGQNGFSADAGGAAGGDDEDIDDGDKKIQEIDETHDSRNSAMPSKSTSISAGMSYSSSMSEGHKHNLRMLRHQSALIKLLEDKVETLERQNTRLRAENERLYRLLQLGQYSASNPPVIMTDTGGVSMAKRDSSKRKKKRVSILRGVAADKKRMLTDTHRDEPKCVKSSGNVPKTERRHAGKQGAKAGMSAHKPTFGGFKRIKKALSSMSLSPKSTKHNGD